MVYGQQSQPFITEVFTHVDPGTLKPDYVAIELYNPYEPGTVTNTHPGPYFDMGTAGTLVGLNPPAPAGARLIHLGALIGVMDRTALSSSGSNPSAPSAANCEDITPAWAPTDIIAPGGYLVIESDKTKRPAGVVPTMPSGNAPTQIPQLMDVFAGHGPLVNNGEIILTRTRAATGVPAVVAAAADPDPVNQYNETVGAPLFLTRVPMDQMDFTGWGGATALVADGRYDYTRPTPPAVALASPDKMYWRCVFPNAVTGTYANTYFPVAGGLMSAVPAVLPTDTTNARLNGSLGAPDPGFYTGAVPTADALSWPVIQLNNVDWPGPAGTTTPTTNKFPFGGFARLGDILQVPYIGSYMLSLSGTIPTFQEVMSVSMDSRYAEDSNPDATAGNEGNLPPATVVAGDNSLADNVDEQIGRFCSLAACRPLDTTGHPRVVYTAPVASGPVVTDDYYWWASRLFDYFSVSAPNTETFPDGSPYTYPVTVPGMPTGVNKDGVALPPYITFGRVNSSPPLTAASVNSISALNLSNVDALYNGCVIEFLSGAAKGECVRVKTYASATKTIGFQTILLFAPADGDLFRIVANPTVGLSTQGLININTASWKVLSMLPLVRNLDGSIDNAAPNWRNDEMAQAIVNYRNTYGPFKSIVDLNNVPLGATGFGFQNGGDRYYGCAAYRPGRWIGERRRRAAGGHLPGRHGESVSAVLGRSAVGRRSPRFQGAVLGHHPHQQHDHDALRFVHRILAGSGLAERWDDLGDDGVAEAAGIHSRPVAGEPDELHGAVDERADAVMGLVSIRKLILEKV